MAYRKTRSKTHDYHSRSIYLITLNKATDIPPFSRLFGGIGSSVAIPGVHTSLIGDVIKTQLRNIPLEYPDARILQYIIMPDHVHLVIFIQRDTAYHLGELIGKFMGNCTRAYGKELPIFEEGYHDRILRGRSQLRSMIDYVRDNPRRLMIKRNHKNLFLNGRILKVGDCQFQIFGNFMLLRDPVKAAVKVSSKYSPEELMDKYALWDETIRQRGVLISPFISRAEKDIRDKAIEEGAKIILITKNELGEKFKPAKMLFDLCAEGRLLIISTWHGRNQESMTRAEAMAMNDLAEKLSRELPECSVSLR